MGYKQEMIVSHTCTRVPLLHQLLVQLAEPFILLAVHLQFKKQPDCQALVYSSMGCVWPLSGTQGPSFGEFGHLPLPLIWKKSFHSGFSEEPADPSQAGDLIRRM